MFEINDKKNIKVTVRFSESEVELMEKYMNENNIKSKSDLIRLALSYFVKQSANSIFFGLMEINNVLLPGDVSSDQSDIIYRNASKKIFMVE